MIFTNRAAAVAACALACAAFSAPAQATNYNVIVFNDFTGENCDVEGALAAGGTITLSGYAVGKKLTAADDGSDTLVAGKAIAFSNGQLYHGNAVAPSISGDAYFASGAKVIGSALDFAGLAASYDAASSFYAGQAATGTVQDRDGTMTLAGALSGLNVFDLDGSTLGSVGLFNLDLPSDGYALINVSGTAASFLNMDFQVNSTPASHILFNFDDATALALGGVGFEGSILAPHADVAFDNGHLDGQLIADSMTGTGQINDFLPDPAVFTGVGLSTPTSAVAAPEPGIWMMMITGFGAIGTVLRRRSARTRGPAPVSI